jgi:hypothetical protein
MPGIARLGHFIELGFSMTVVGLFMAWLFVKKAGEQTRETASQKQSAAVPT